MIFNILSVTIARVLGCLQHVATCGGSSSAFVCPSAGGPAPGTPEHMLPKVQQLVLLLKKGTEGPGVLVSGTQSVPGKYLLN